MPRSRLFAAVLELSLYALFVCQPIQAAFLSKLPLHLKLVSTNCIPIMVIFFQCKLDRMEIDAIRLRQLREERALSLRELEQLAGVSYNTIWRIEDGRRKQAHPRTIRKLSAALGVEPQELVVRD